MSVALAGAVWPSPTVAQGERWWADVEALAHDSMRGREAGTPEHRRAAEYVAAAFARAGLAPAGTDGYFQPVPLVTRSVDEARSRLTLVRGRREEPLVLGEDAYFLPRAPLAPEVDAPIVFAGYGLHLPEYGHDDLAGLDLRGKVVATVAGLPRGLPPTVVSHARAVAWRAFHRAGAVGTIAFTPARDAEAAWRRAARARLMPQMMIADSALDPQAGNRLSVRVNASRAQRLFAGAPAAFAELAARADSGLPLPRFDLAARIRSQVAVREHTVASDNVAGVLRGSDPAARDEYVVVTAHLDHVGVGRPVDGDSIYNGAMDNASGTALLLETARQLTERGTPLRRSVLFLAVTAEEKGLLGSRYFAHRPTVPPAGIVANLNTDMFLPFLPFRMVMANGLEESDLAADAGRAGAAAGVPVVTDPEPEENRFVRSDQYSFVERGIPALSVKIGFTRDSPEHGAVRGFRATRYHLPADDASQPVDLAAAAGFADFYRRLVEEVANRPTRPAWNPDSFFRRFADGAVAGGP
jgi:hypothetical protein